MAEKRQNPHKYKEPKPIASKGAERFWFYFAQFTWGLPVNLFGAIAFLICKLLGNPSEKFCNAFIVYIKAKKFGGLSLGVFIFMNAQDKEPWRHDTRIHEYGHTIQCMLLGVFYWIVVGLPSAIWCNCFEGYRKKHNVSYYKLYCESWANKWGQKWANDRQSFNSLPKVKATRKV